MNLENSNASEKYLNIQNDNISFNEDKYNELSLEDIYSNIKIKGETNNDLYFYSNYREDYDSNTSNKVTYEPSKFNVLFINSEHM